MPAKATAGSLVRYLWNAAAVVQMYWYGLGWGGSLAFKAKLLRETDLLQCLANAFTDDITTCRCAGRHGYRVAFAPSLLMVNRETCSLKGLFGFLQRQLLCVRLHDPWWRAVVAHGVATTATLMACGYLAAYAALTAGWTTAAWTGGALAAYWISMAAMLVPLEWCARRIVRGRGESAAGLGYWQFLRAALTVPLAQAVQFAAIASRHVRPRPSLARRSLSL